MKKVLIVDDNNDNLDMLGLLFEDEGFAVQQLGNANLIDNYITVFNPDLLLLDVLLGIDNGIRICKALKSNENTKHIAIILMTASDLFKNIDPCSCLADSYIQKPFDLDELVAIANALVSGV